MNTLNAVLKEFKNKLSTRNLLLKYISFKKRILIYLLVSLMIGSLFASLNSKWFLVLMILFELILIGYVKIVTNQIKAWKYGSSDDFQQTRYKLLIDILSKKEIYHQGDVVRTKEKLLLFVALLNSKLSGNKKGIPVLGLLTTIFITIVRFGVEHKYPTEIYISLFTLVIMLFGVYMMFSPIINELLNKDRNKMEEMRNMIVEHLLKDIL